MQSIARNWKSGKRKKQVGKIRIGRSKRPISYSKAFNDLAYLFWLNGPRIASQGLTGIKFCELSRTIRPSCLFCVFAYSRPHSLTCAAHYGIMAMTIHSWPWQMWRLCENFHFLLLNSLRSSEFPVIFVFYTKITGLCSWIVLLVPKPTISVGYVSRGTSKSPKL